MLEWLPIGLPVAALMLPLTWVFLTRVAFPIGRYSVRGGLSLAAAIERNGVYAFIASAVMGLQGLELIWCLLAVAALMVFLTEITSNTAVTATLLPVLAATASALGLPPAPVLIAATLSASCAFMLPVATPPNAVVFASGKVRVGQMAGARLGFNLIAIFLITGLVYLNPFAQGF
jgi:sodium-dependent dicarboxylate transporter 2/3/5